MSRAPRKTSKGEKTKVETFVHTDEQRTNIPTAELETFMKDEDRAPTKVTYPRPSELLYPRDPAGDPQLVWRGKDEQDRRPLEVMAPPIYIQEKIHPKAIIEDLRKQKKGESPEQANLFSDFNGIAFEDLVDFYQHEQHWSNRMILGDSLEVMTSLAEREGLKGQVQCMYIDPPYGVRFGSNWQVSTRKRDVADGKPSAATRQPEQVKAFRDTWELGIHSYLGYLRDRLAISHLLLSETGSVFVQIGEQNAHLVRAVLDEVFGASNALNTVTFTKTSSEAGLGLPNTADYILWYAKDHERVKTRPLYVTKRAGDEGARQYLHKLGPDGTVLHLEPNELADPAAVESGWRICRRGFPLTSQNFSETRSGPVTFDGQEYVPGADRHWSLDPEVDIPALAAAGRIYSTGRSLNGIVCLDEMPSTERGNVWTDTGTGSFTQEQIYVVQTSEKVTRRCLALATDPGDLVVDPTCGSGTTAYVAELLGRRWITVDTSRVALALTRGRLIGSRFPYFRLRSHDIRAGFHYKELPHKSLSDIARGTSGNPRPMVDDPVEDPAIVRVTGPFTVESLSPNDVFVSVRTTEVAEPTPLASSNFTVWILDNLRVAGVQNTVRNERLTFDRLERWPGKYIHAIGEYSENGAPRRAAVTIGPQYGTVDADLVRDAAKESAGFFDILVVCGFAFDAYITNEFRQLGNLTILKANMNPDLSMGGDLLKKTGTGNLFTVFGEPDIDIRYDDGSVVAEIKGLDVYDPTTGHVRSHTTDDVACWFIDTAYDGNSFFVRHAYFTGAGDPYKSLKAALKADIDEEAWASLYSTVSRPFDMPKTGRIAVKVINHYGDEVMKVYDAPAENVLELPRRSYPEDAHADDRMVADRPQQDE